MGLFQEVVVEEGIGEEGADCDAECEKGYAQYARRHFRWGEGFALEVFAEEDVERGHGAKCQQVVFGNAVEIDFRYAYQCPVAKEHGKDNIDPLGKCQDYSDGEYCHGARHHRGCH